MRPMTMLLAVLFAMAFIACAGMPPQYKEVQLPPARIYQKGYSLVPLNEKGWSIGQRNQIEVVIGKRGEGKNIDETFIIHATLVRLSPYTDTQELVRKVKEGQEKDIDSQRYRMVRHDVTFQQEKGADCTKSHALSEDTAAVKKSERPGSMMLEILTLTCSHPKERSIGVNIAYSHRYFPEQKDSQFTEKATSVLSSIEFDGL